MRQFPGTRLRRLRSHPALRTLVRETHLSPADFIYPIFVVERPESAGEVPSMPGVFRQTLDTLPRQIDRVAELGVPAVMLFGIPEHKDALGSQACADGGVIVRAIQRAARAAGDAVAVIADLCLCEYTDHGHCGLIRGDRIDNDATLDLLRKAAVTYAQSGAAMVAPSGMMDGMVGAIRGALDAAGNAETAILSYAVKYASAFYGPFRDAAECAPKFGDRRTHQMDPANAREALAEAELDLAEGTDILMVKPATPYLDVIRDLRAAQPSVPLAAYHVSGEYSMIKAAAARGWIDERRIALETLTGIKRAGADAIITYYACEVAAWLRGASPSAP
ncbi:MAG: porphobilinogen synthase [Phycisphaerae bacterium]|nr:MAG: porphobilinogen synthase [Planctomycetota bacterium]KAB2947615.1 MAG: porphobilinogen synthase [Phycisphaerae bacterium]MBE7455721.1 porphobilinogen synthase [Planctomycetia bacterium]MCK6463357.1 porphobilinogen synthase [Phycisphaerae bacterium]MCL4716979.1 porphobilinogen synthase [Phycisphaerae bacterium]